MQNWKPTLDGFDQTRQQSNPIPTIQHSNQQSTPQQPSTSLPIQPAINTTKPEIQKKKKKKKKRNEKTRQQYKRRKALRVTVQEVEHSSQVRVAHVNKPRKHVVLERTKQVPWDGSHTSLQRSEYCWYAVIQMDGMTMVRHEISGMPRIGIG